MIKLTLKNLFLIFLCLQIDSIQSVSEDEKKLKRVAGRMYDLINLDDTFHLQKALFISNYLGLCILPRTAIASRRFLEAFYRKNGIDRAKYNHVLEVNNMLNRTFEYDEMQVRIPFLTHHVWVTSVDNPREMVDVLQDPHIKAQLSIKISYLNYLLTADPLSYDKQGNQVHKWEHIFWVNDKSIIPKSVKFMERAGYVVKELRELQVFQSGLLKIALNKYIDENKPGAASDFVKSAIIFEKGGFYQDLDFWLTEWDIRIHRALDYFGWNQMQHEIYTVTYQYSIISRPNHPIQRHYLESFSVNFGKDQETNNLVHKDCFNMTLGATLYDTGPFLYDLAFLKTYQLGENDQILVAPDIDVHHSWSANLNLSTGVQIKIQITGEQPGQGSWSDDFNDSLIFGWSKLNKYKF
eukprot:403341678